MSIAAAFVLMVSNYSAKHAPVSSKTLRIGETVWGTPRSMASIITKMNRVDMSRRSPSYELRLAKYARRGWEVYYPPLQRENVNPEVTDPILAFHVCIYRMLISVSYMNEVSQHCPWV